MMKVLWVVVMDTAAVEQLLPLAKRAGVGRLVIRSSSQALQNAIARFHGEQIEIYAWRWPATTPGHAGHWYAEDEAAYVADTLVPAGLDGYVVDPESDKAGSADDWNSAHWTSLAERFCATIKTAADARGGAFSFCLTSGCAYPDAHHMPQIPWAAFVSASDRLHPQSYWRVETNHGVAPANGHTPLAAIDLGVNAWGRVAQGKPIIPMAGELRHITPTEIAAYGAEMKRRAMPELHFYNLDVHTPAANLDAIAAL